MEKIQKPELTPLDIGDSLKTLQVTALAGMRMPPHYTTKEAVIVVHQGEALLKMPNVDHRLKQGAVFIVPAGVEHTLEIIKDFKAVVIMGADSDINFK
ncbi:Cupin domain-containing protein [Gillisia sp. Hel_I_86]|uniref:cupin domain-containing protein n=1 Tax=Gillisia sp. Hel_I_86 TaxID=1249981 RepID=UPI001199D608|nr:cupin domain-containing protein [Gillisia sp. Hel_I_86]TVZ28626.1 Cupin domain-containing protein [Gillisia sp. Hel_I_86]